MERAREIRTDEAPAADSFGVRRRRLGAPDDESVLELRPELTQCASFEFALRERTGRLVSFHAPGFVRVRRVERTPGTRTLAIVSDTVDGAPLGRVIRSFGASGRRIPPEWAGLAATQLTSAVAALHATHSDVVHAALAPDRIIVTSASEPLICDYVLGSAIEQLGYSQRRYWDELGIAVPGLTHPFEQRVDLLQLGFIALAMFVGRELDVHALEPDVHRALVESISAPQVADASRVRNWIARLLGLESPFRGAADAAAEARSVFEGCESAGANIAIELPSSSFELAPAIVGVSAEPPRPDETDEAIDGATTTDAAARALEAAAPQGLSAGDCDAAGDDAAVQDTPISASAAVADPSARVELPEIAADAGLRPLMSSDGDGVAAVQVAPAVVPNLRRRSRYGWPAAVVIAVAGTIAAIGIGVVHHPVARLVIAPPHGSPSAPPAPKFVQADEAITTIAAAAPSANGRLTIRTQPPGAAVSVDGSSQGRSPLTIDVAAGEHTVTVSADDSVVKTTVTVERATSTSVVVPLGHRPTAVPVGGWVRVVAPFDTQVFEGDQLVGSSASSRLMMAAGTHTLDLVNTELGYRERRSVQVTGGQITALTIAAPQGTLALNAQPWADVWLDGEHLGPTPLGNVSIPIGTHDIVFRHPTLGERHHSVKVQLSGITRMSADMTAR